jgi:hypothetical protein
MNKSEEFYSKVKKYIASLQSSSVISGKPLPEDEKRSNKVRDDWYAYLTSAGLLRVRDNLEFVLNQGLHVTLPCDDPRDFDLAYEPNPMFAAKRPAKIENPANQEVIGRFQELVGDIRAGSDVLWSGKRQMSKVEEREYAQSWLEAHKGEELPAPSKELLDKFKSWNSV